MKVFENWSVREYSIVIFLLLFLLFIDFFFMNNTVNLEVGDLLYSLRDGFFLAELIIAGGFSIIIALLLLIIIFEYITVKNERDVSKEVILKLESELKRLKGK